jgi:hypothetical protein
MESVYHIVAIRVHEISWAHVWRLCFRYLGTGYDNFLQIFSECLDGIVKFLVFPWIYSNVNQIQHRFKLDFLQICSNRVFGWI